MNSRKIIYKTGGIGMITLGFINVGLCDINKQKKHDKVMVFLGSLVLGPIVTFYITILKEKN